MPVLQWYAPSPAGLARRLPCPVVGRAMPLLSGRCHIPGITVVIMGAWCVKVMIMVGG
jgi:hypothetical protein